MNQKVFFYDPDKKVETYLGPGLYGTTEIQKIIYENQFPKDCSKQNYIVIKDFEKRIAGLGATLNFISAFFAKSVNQNRTLMFFPNSTSFHSSKKHCSETSGLDCFFLPITNCSFPSHVITSNKRKFKIYSLHSRYGLSPPLLDPIIQKTGTPKNLYYFYWRAQTSFFLVRYNPFFTKFLEKFKKKSLINEKKIYDVSISVRHGDKGVEMTLINTTDYVYPLELLSKLFNRKLSVFVSSDNQNAIDSLLSLNSDKFEISYFNYQRSKKGFAVDNSVDMFNNSIHSFAELSQSIKAKYIIGTIRSNWNNLILQLRLQYLPPMELPYFEVGNKKCITPYHCKFFNQEFSLFS